MACRFSYILQVRKHPSIGHAGKSANGAYAMADSSPDQQWLAICPLGSTAVHIFPCPPHEVQQEKPLGVFDPAIEGTVPFSENDGVKHLLWAPDSSFLAVGTADGSLYMVSRLNYRLKFSATCLSDLLVVYGETLPAGLPVLSLHSSLFCCLLCRQ